MSTDEQTPGQPALEVAPRANTASEIVVGNPRKKFWIVLVVVVILIVLAIIYFIVASILERSRMEKASAEEEVVMTAMITGRIYDFEEDQIQLKVGSGDEVRIVSITVDENTSISEIETVDSSSRRAIGLVDLILDNLVSVISDSNTEDKTQIYAKEIILIQ